MNANINPTIANLLTATQAAATAAQAAAQAAAEAAQAAATPETWDYLEDEAIKAVRRLAEVLIQEHEGDEHTIDKINDVASIALNAIYLMAQQ